MASCCIQWDAVKIPTKLAGRKICVSGVVQFPCCVVFHLLAFAALGACGLPVDDSPLAEWMTALDTLIVSDSV